jgi:hypothetical protein
VEAIKSCFFKGSEVDLCLCTKHSSLGMVMMIAIYIDYCLTIGTEEAIKEVINEPKGHNFGLNIEDNLKCQHFSRKRQRKVLEHETISH